MQVRELLGMDPGRVRTYKADGWGRTDEEEAYSQDAFLLESDYFNFH